MAGIHFLDRDMAVAWWLPLLILQQLHIFYIAAGAESEADGADVEEQVVVYAVDGVPGYTTYQLSLRLGGRAKNLYAIAALDSKPISVPPAYQVAPPFGTNVGGVNPLYFAYTPEAEFDSWLTAGVTVGGQSASSIGLDFDVWSAEQPLLAYDGAVFWMSPDDAEPRRASVSDDAIDCVVARLTVAMGSQFDVLVGRAQGRTFATAASASVTNWEKELLIFRNYLPTPEARPEPTPMPEPRPNSVPMPEARPEPATLEPRPEPIPESTPDPGPEPLDPRPEPAPVADQLPASEPRPGSGIDLGAGDGYGDDGVDPGAGDVAGDGYGDEAVVRPTCMVFTECGSACAPECSAAADDARPVCSMACVSRYQCPDNLWWHAEMRCCVPDFACGRLQSASWASTRSLCEELQCDSVFTDQCAQDDTSCERDRARERGDESGVDDAFDQWRVQFEEWQTRQTLLDGDSLDEATFCRQLELPLTDFEQLFGVQQQSDGGGTPRPPQDNRQATAAMGEACSVIVGYMASCSIYMSDQIEFARLVMIGEACARTEGVASDDVCRAIEGAPTTMLAQALDEDERADKCVLLQRMVDECQQELSQRYQEQLQDCVGREIFRDGDGTEERLRFAINGSARRDADTYFQRPEWRGDRDGKDGCAQRLPDGAVAQRPDHCGWCDPDSSADRASCGCVNVTTAPNFAHDIVIMQPLLAVDGLEISSAADDVPGVGVRMTSKVVAFNVAACSDAHLSLFEDLAEESEKYEIVLGGWSNSRTLIRTNRTTLRQPQLKPSILVSVETANILSCTHRRPFWLAVNTRIGEGTASGGTLQLGQGEVAGERVLLEWREPQPQQLDINFVGLESGWGSSGRWKVCHNGWRSSHINAPREPMAEPAPERGEEPTQPEGAPQPAPPSPRDEQREPQPEPRRPEEQKVPQPEPVRGAQPQAEPANQQRWPRAQCPEQTSCGTMCPLICGQRDSTSCAMQCTVGSQCPNDLWWDADAGCCVPEAACSIHSMQCGIDLGCQAPRLDSSSTRPQPAPSPPPPRIIDTEVELAGAVDAQGFAQGVQQSLPPGSQVTVSSFGQIAKTDATLLGVGTASDFAPGSEAVLQFRQGVASTVAVELADVVVERVEDLQRRRRLQAASEDRVRVFYMVATADAATASHVATTMSDTQMFMTSLSSNVNQAGTSMGGISAIPMLGPDDVTTEEPPEFVTIIQLEIAVPVEDGADTTGDAGSSTNEAAALVSLQDTQTLAAAANSARTPGTPAVQVTVASSSAESGSATSPSPAPPRDSVLTPYVRPQAADDDDDDDSAHMSATVLAIIFGFALSLCVVIGAVLYHVECRKRKRRKTARNSSGSGNRRRDDDSFGEATIDMMRNSAAMDDMDSFDTDSIVDSTYRRSLSQNSGISSGNRYVSPLLVQGEVPIEPSPAGTSRPHVKIESSPMATLVEGAPTPRVNGTPPTTPKELPTAKFEDEPVLPNRDYRP